MSDAGKLVKDARAYIDAVAVLPVDAESDDRVIELMRDKVRGLRVKRPIRQRSG